MQSSLAEPGTAPPPVAPSRRRNKLWFGLLAGVACIVAITLIFLPAKKQASPLNSSPAISSIDSDQSVRLKGTTQAVHTRAIQAPTIAGQTEGTLTLTSLRPAGARVKKGDLLVEFDRQAQLRDFIDKQAQNNKLTDDLLQEQAKEDAARAKDETEIKVAEGALGKAELEMQKVELLSRIDAEKARENLEEAKVSLDQLKQTFDLKRRAAKASIRILEIQRDRARETMQHAQANAALMQVHSPIDGIVVLNMIWKEGSIGEVQEGDQVRPGVPFMQVVDPSAMEVQVSVSQQDVLSLHDGQKARIHLDAYPDLICPAELEIVDPMGRNGDFSSKVRTFLAIWSVGCSDPRLLPGLSAAVDLEPADSQSGRVALPQAVH